MKPENVGRREVDQLDVKAHSLAARPVRRAWELFALLNPIHHGGTPKQIATYKVEPYVVAADVYAVAPHTGRGGWTWYTGSAGWMYRLLIETLTAVSTLSLVCANVNNL